MSKRVTESNTGRVFAFADVCCLGGLKHENNTLGIRLHLSNSSVTTEQGQKTGEHPNRIKPDNQKGGSLFR